MTRILIVDDEEPVRAVVERLLSLHGYAVDQAADGAQAIDQLRKKRYDLMIIDQNMPRMTGIEAVAVIRTSPKFNALKILMVTLTSLNKDVEDAFAAGIDDYVIKPFNMNKLLQKVKTILDSGPRRV